MRGENDELSAMTKQNFIFAFNNLEDYMRGGDLYIGVDRDRFVNVLNMWTWFVNVLNIWTKPN